MDAVELDPSRRDGAGRRGSLKGCSGQGGRIGQERVFAS
jgi:hypothetical protein